MSLIPHVKKRGKDIINYMSKKKNPQANVMVALSLLVLVLGFFVFSGNSNILPASSGNARLNVVHDNTRITGRETTGTLGDGGSGGSFGPQSTCYEYSFYSNFAPGQFVGQGLKHQKIGEFTITNNNPLNCPQEILKIQNASIDLTSSFLLNGNITNLTITPGTAVIASPSSIGNSFPLNISLDLNRPTQIISVYADIGATVPFGGTLSASLSPVNARFEVNNIPVYTIPSVSIPGVSISVSCISSIDALAATNIRMDTSSSGSSTLNGRLNLCAPQQVYFQYTPQSGGAMTQTVLQNVANNGDIFSHDLNGVLTPGRVYNFLACTLGGATCSAPLSFRIPSYSDCGNDPSDFRNGYISMVNNMPSGSTVLQGKKGERIGSYKITNSCVSFSKHLDLTNLITGLSTSPFAISNNITNLNGIAYPSSVNNIINTSILYPGQSVTIDLVGDIGTGATSGGNISTTLRPQGKLYNDATYPDNWTYSAVSGSSLKVRPCPVSTISVSGISSSSASLTGLGACVPTASYFKYKNDLSIGKVTPTLAVSANNLFSFKVLGLAGNTRYSFQACGKETGGVETCGSWLSFKTASSSN